MAVSRIGRALAYAGALATAIISGGLASCAGDAADGTSTITDDGGAPDAPADGASDRAAPGLDAKADTAPGADADVDAGDDSGPDPGLDAGDDARAADGGGDAADTGAEAGGAGVLVLSQIQTRGDNSGSDEFVEIYNAGSAPVTLDASWAVKVRSAASTLSTCASNALATRFTGSGQVIPAHGHLLFANAQVPGYNGATAADGTYTTAIPDAASVVLTQNDAPVDAVCFYYDATTQGVLGGCATPYTCEGTPVQNPHDNTTATNVDASLERKPGGAGGNGTNTGNNASDFAATNPSDPHDLASAPVP